MLDFNGALAILKNNGFDSLTTYPLVYRSGSKIGLTYTFDSQYYGNLERVKICENEEELDLLVKKIKWYRENGKLKKVALVLDSYTHDDPNIKFIHNGNEIDYETMLNIDEYDENARKELEGSDVKRIIFEIERLFKYYEHVKTLLTEYIDSVNKSMDILYNSYKTLQSRIDLYNDYKEERVYEPVKVGRLDLNIDIVKQNELKDSFNHLKVSDAPYEELFELLKKVWSFCMNVELNETYIKSMKVKNAIDNEQNLVNQKLRFMEKVLSKKGLFNGIKNIPKRFKKIERKFITTSLMENFDELYTNAIINKYKRFQEINIFNTSAYLEDALENSDYESLVAKYKDRIEITLDSSKADENKVVGDLNFKYNSLTQEEKDKLILINSEYFDLIDLVINVEDYKVKTGEELLQVLSTNEDFKKIMGRCYNLVSEILPFNDNPNILRILNYFNFDTEEDFLISIVNLIEELLLISKKLVVSDDIMVYFKTFNYDNFNDRLLKVYFDVSRVICDVKSDDLRYVIVDLKKDTYVFYSKQNLLIPVNGESEIRVIDNQFNTLQLLSRNIVIDWKTELVKVSNYRSSVVRDAGYSYVEAIKSELDFNFVNCEISKRM